MSPDEVYARALANLRLAQISFWVAWGALVFVVAITVAWWFFGWKTWANHRFGFPLATLLYALAVLTPPITAFSFSEWVRHRLAATKAAIQQAQEPRDVI